MARVAGKVAFITGAARGQGRSDALRLASEGADIIAVDLCDDVPTVPYPLATRDDLAETVRLVESLGRRATGIVADVRDSDAIQQAFDDGVAQLGDVEIVVVNAGVVAYGLSWTLTEQQWDAMIDINLKGAWHTTKAAIPHLIAGGRGGSIVINSSKEGIKALPTLAHYTAAKHGVIGLARALSLELAEHMIRVNTIAATAVNTPMIHNDAAYSLFMPHIENPTLDDAAAAFGALNPMPIPWVETDDVSNAVLFFASSESRYITGTTLPVDAGASQK